MENILSFFLVLLEENIRPKFVDNYIYYFLKLHGYRAVFFPLRIRNGNNRNTVIFPLRTYVYCSTELTRLKRTVVWKRGKKSAVQSFLGQWTCCSRKGRSARSPYINTDVTTRLDRAKLSLYSNQIYAHTGLCVNVIQ